MKFLKWCAIILVAAFLCGGIYSLMGNVEDIEFPWEKEEEPKEDTKEDTPSKVETEELVIKWTTLEGEALAEDDEKYLAIAEGYAGEQTYVKIYKDIPEGALVDITVSYDESQEAGNPWHVCRYSDLFMTGYSFISDGDDLISFCVFGAYSETGSESIVVKIGVVENQDNGKVKIGTFGIGDKEYEFEWGMTFAQWVNSKYNTDGFKVYDDMILSADEEGCLYNKNAKICPGKEYSLEGFQFLEFEGTNFVLRSGMIWSSWVGSNYNLDDKFYVPSSEIPSVMTFDGMECVIAKEFSDGTYGYVNYMDTIEFSDSYTYVVTTYQ